MNLRAQFSLHFVILSGAVFAAESKDPEAFGTPYAARTFQVRMLSRSVDLNTTRL